MFFCEEEKETPNTDIGMHDCWKVFEQLHSMCVLKDIDWILNVDTFIFLRKKEERTLKGILNYS